MGAGLGPVGHSRPARAAGSAGAMVYRKPARPEQGSQNQAAERSGEEVLKAQTVSPAQAAAMSAAYSYGAEMPRVSRTAADGALTPEQEDQIAERILQEINYNRMAAEVLDRVERRLRAERRKFGR